jgi:hypothetical protein
MFCLAEQTQLSFDVYHPYPKTEEAIMYSVEKPSQLIMTSVGHHVAAAERHDEAAESHRQAAAHYTYGDYQQANEQARLAKGFGERAEEHCSRAME